MKSMILSVVPFFSFLGALGCKKVNFEGVDSGSELSAIQPVSGSMTCNGVSDQEYGDTPDATWKTRMVYEIKIPRDVDSRQNLSEQYATLTAWREKKADEKWSFKLQYDQGNSGQWRHVTDFKFKLVRKNQSEYELTHKVKNIAGQDGQTILKAKINCGQSASSVPPAVVPQPSEVASNCNWYNLKPGEKLLLWAHGIEDKPIGEYNVSQGTELGQTGEYKTTATRVHVFVTRSGNKAVEGKKGYVDLDTVNKLCK